MGQGGHGEGGIMEGGEVGRVGVHGGWGPWGARGARADIEGLGAQGGGGHGRPSIHHQPPILCHSSRMCLYYYIGCTLRVAVHPTMHSAFY